MNIEIMIMTLVFLLGLAKKNASNNDAPFWEQMSLSGNRSLEWVGKDMGKLKVEKLYFGKIAYFHSEFDFENVFKHIKNLSLESTVVLLKCSNFDRMILCFQSGAIKHVMKVLLVQSAENNIKTHGLCELYLDEHGKTEVQVAEFDKPISIEFVLVDDGKNRTHYEIKIGE